VSGLWAQGPLRALYLTPGTRGPNARGHITRPAHPVLGQTLPICCTGRERTSEIHSTSESILPILTIVRIVS
jgi:hypothetical protein